MKPLRFVLTKYPITRGMLVYAILWPSSDFCRQLGAAGFQHEKFTADIQRLVRFSLFGSLWVAPTVYAWVRLSGRLVAGTTIRSAMKKAVLEQFTYGPFSIVAFYFGMNKLEGKSTEHSIEEVKNKFVSTWKAGATVWPIVQTVNFAFVPERNRVAFVGLASFMWTTYLSFMEASS